MWKTDFWYTEDTEKTDKMIWQNNHDCFTNPQYHQEITNEHSHISNVIEIINSR